MAALEFHVPPEFWADAQPATLHYRRLRPGVFDRVPNDVVEPFLAGTMPLRVEPGWHEFLEVLLEPKAEAIKPRLCLRRIPIDGAGRIDRAQLEADRSLPQEERRAKHGWLLSAREQVQFENAMAKLVDSYEDPVLSSFLDIFSPNVGPLPVAKAGGASRKGKR